MQYACNILRIDQLEESKGPKPKGGHGGWLPKAAKLVAAYLGRRWRKCDDLCEFYVKHDIVRQIVAKEQLS